MHFLTRTRSQAPPPGERPVGEDGRLQAGWQGRVWKRFIAWVIVPPMLLCMVELGLRLAGFGISMQLFIPRKVNGEAVCVTNKAFYQQFYTHSFQKAPYEFSMPAKKPADSYRVFVFGESAAHGYPMPDFSFARILATMLRACRPAGKTEVYNVALPGADAHVMRAAARACAKYQPDLFLVYMGNNELNPLVSQTLVFDWLPPQIALRCFQLSVALNDLRLVQLLRGIKGPADLDRIHGTGNGPVDSERAYKYYQANVKGICDSAKAAGARVILCTLGSRLREWPPGGESPEFLDSITEQVGNEVHDAESRRKYKQALAACMRAFNADGRNAWLAYGVACCHHALGEYTDARSWFVRARELDFTHVRPAARINDILLGIAETGRDDAVRLLDTAKSFADGSPHGIEGPEFFVDHVHFTFEGNYALARSVLEGMAGFYPSLGIQTPPLSIEECGLRLALTEVDLRDLLLMTRQSYSGIMLSRESLNSMLAELDARVGDSADDIRLKACLNAAQADPLDEVVRLRCVRLLGDGAAALDQAKRLVADFPHSWEALRHLSWLLGIAGEREGAIDALRKSLALHPDDADACMELGRFLFEEDRLVDALAAFRASFRIKPCAQVQNEIARVLRRQGNAAGAIKADRRSLQLKPNDVAVFKDLVLTLCDANRLAEAKEEIRRWRAEAHEYGQGSAASQQGAGRTRSAPGNAAEETPAETRLSVLRELYDALPHDPGTADTFRGLFVKEAARLETAGDLRDAVIACREAVLLDPHNKAPLPFLRKVLARCSPAERRTVWGAVWRDNPGLPTAAAPSATTEDSAGTKQPFRNSPKDSGSADTFQSLFVDEGGRLEAAGDLPGAVSAYREAIRLDPQNIEPLRLLENALSQGSTGEHRAVWEATLAVNPGNPHVAMFCGMARAAAGDLAGATQLFRTLPENLNSAGVFQGLFVDEGMRLEAAGNLSGAVGAYREAIPLYPQNHEPVRRLENVLSKCGPAERRSVWEATLGDNPDNPHVAVLCGIARLAADDVEGAKLAFDISRRLAPEEWHYSKLAADALASAGVWDDAVSGYERALTPNPGLGCQPLLVATGCRNELAGDIPGAMDAFKSAILADPSNPEPYWRLDTACPKTNPEIAVGLWRGIWESVPENAVVDVLYGESLAAANSAAAARTLVEAALRLGGNDSNVLARAGNVYSSMADWAQAKACYDRALAINPGLEFLHRRLEDVQKGAAGAGASKSP